MRQMTELETQLSKLIISELNLEIDLEQVTSQTPLYDDGLGLDSIDILEIALIISKHYGLELRSDNPENKTIFASLGDLAAYVQTHRTK